MLEIPHNMRRCQRIARALYRSIGYILPLTLFVIYGCEQWERIGGFPIDADRENIADTEFDSPYNNDADQESDAEQERDAEQENDADHESDADIEIDYPTIGRLAVGGRSSCFGQENGDIDCWGILESPPISHSNMLAVGKSGSNVIGCEFSHDRGVTCWGFYLDEIRNFESRTNLTQIDIGLNIICGISENEEIECWSLLESWAELIVPIGNFSEVALSHSDDICALRTNGEIVCWNYGILTEFVDCVDGMGGDVRHCAMYYRVLDVDEQSQLSINADFGCSVGRDRRLQCWYLPHQFPYDDSNYRAMIPPPGEYLYVEVSECCAVCAVRGDRRVACWGREPLGDAPLPTGPPPFDTNGELYEGEVVELRVGDSHACVLSLSDEVLCWGDNSMGQSMPPSS